MKKLLLLTAIAGLFTITNVNAQSVKDPAMSGAKLGIGAEFGFPVNEGSEDALLFGGSLRYEHPVANKLRLTGSAGYTSFTLTGDRKDAANDLGLNTSVGFIPVKAGLKYFVAENFYLGGELGATFSTENGGGTAFAYSPGLGIEFPVDDKLGIDFGARYEGWSNDGTLSFIGLRAALNFGL